MKSQACITCHAPAYTACVAPYTNKETTMHVARKTVEFGDWTEIYDRQYASGKFRIRKYGRKKVA